MGLDEYARLDFEKLKQTILLKADDESKFKRISLSSPLESSDLNPPLFTSAMSAWYQANIAGKRQAAIVGLRQLHASRLTPSGAVGGVVPDIALDSIENDRYREKLHEVTTFHNSGEVQQYNQSISLLQQEYDDIYQRVRRHAQIYSKFLEYGIVAGVDLIEYPLNYNAFSKITIFRDIPALIFASVTTLVFLAFFGTFLLGRILKQWTARFGPGVKDRDKLRTRIELALAVACLTILSVFVWWSRTALITASSVFDERNTDLVSTYGVAIGGNIGIIVVGIIVVYLFEDAIPGYARLGRTIKFLKEKLQTLRHKRLEQRVHTVEERAIGRRGEVSKHKEIMANSIPEWPQVESAVGRLREVDANVLAILTDYRSLLCARISAEAKFLVRTIELEGVVTQQLSPEDYLGRGLKLPME